MNLPTLFAPSLRDRPEFAGFECDRRVSTFGELADDAYRLANRLLAEGLKPGDRLAVYLENRPELVVAYLAAVHAGFVFTPINILYRRGEIEHILRDAEPRALVAGRASETIVGPVAEAFPEVHLLWAEDLEAWASGSSAAAPSEPAAEDLAALVYTSGTTGRPKGAMLTQANFAANACALVEAWRMSADDRLLLALPLFHVHGLGNGLHTWLATGYRLRLLDRFRKETIAADMLDFRPTVFFGVPTMYERLLETPSETARQIGRFVRLFVSGSAPLPAATLERFEALFGSRILERYGMSETFMIASNPHDGERRAGSVGPALPGVEVCVRDPETGRDVAAGESGEVHVRGANVFSGYWKNPQATLEAFAADGFFRTGDLGSLSTDGYLTLHGRGKELIISSGFNVYPREVEEFLCSLPGVGEAAVVAAQDRVRGEVPIAYVVPRDGERPEPDVLAEACRAGLASFKAPRCFVVVDALPRNALGKVQKHLLREPEGGGWTG